MENASKALLMAGGVLIALLIIGLLIYSFGTMSGYFETENTKEQAEQLKVFNDQYEAYNRKLLRGTDVVSVINKALSNNEKYGEEGYNEPEYIITIEFTMKEEVSYSKDGKSKVFFKVNNPYSMSAINDIKNNYPEVFTDFKRRVFDCEKVQYNKTTGRINYMSFVERKLTDDEYKQGL